MILKNKLTKETLDIPYSEFRIKFAKEIKDAFESYRKTQLNKLYHCKRTLSLRQPDRQFEIFGNVLFKNKKIMSN